MMKYSSGHISKALSNKAPGLQPMRILLPLYQSLHSVGCNLFSAFVFQIYPAPSLHGNSYPKCPIWGTCPQNFQA